MYGGEGGIRTPDTLASMPDFESGAFNRALPPLRFVYNYLRDLLEACSADGSFDGTLYRRNALHRRLLVIHAEVRISLGHLCRPVPQEFSDRVQIHTGHDQSTGEGMTIAMPRVVFKTQPAQRRRGTSHGDSRRWEIRGRLPTRRATLRVLTGLSHSKERHVDLRSWSWADTICRRSKSICDHLRLYCSLMRIPVCIDRSRWE